MFPHGTGLYSLQSSLVIFTTSFEPLSHSTRSQGKENWGPHFRWGDWGPQKRRVCAKWVSHAAWPWLSICYVAATWLGIQTGRFRAYTLVRECQARNTNKQTRESQLWINLGRRYCKMETGKTAWGRPRSGSSLACGRDSQGASVARAQEVRREKITGWPCPVRPGKPWRGCHHVSHVLTQMFKTDLSREVDGEKSGAWSGRLRMVVGAEEVERSDWIWDRL